MIDIKERMGSLSSDERLRVHKAYRSQNMFENGKMFWKNRDVFLSLLRGDSVEPMFGFFSCFRKLFGSGDDFGSGFLGGIDCLMKTMDMFILWCIIWITDFICFWILVGMLVKHWHVLPSWSKWTGLAFVIVTPFVFFPFPVGLIPGFALPFFGIAGVIVVGVGVHVANKKKQTAMTAAPVTVVAASASPRHSGRSPGRSRLRMR